MAPKRNHIGETKDEWYPKAEIVRENAKWEQYYKAQNVCVSEEDFAQLKAALIEPLPVGIRVNSSMSSADDIHKRCDKLSSADDVTKCSRLPFFSDAWQWESLDRYQVKKNPEMKALKHWLMHCESVGALTRQEVVSMIPPLILNAQPGVTVLDMCAAPGSKTTQILEKMSGEGLVIGNDVDWKRANLLAHQVNRMCSPSALITNFDAFYYPGYADGFDRVLCDVPCTADGTLRKTPDIWTSWTPAEGVALHPRQLQILKRGLQLLKDGGVLVYSTCSLNPIENEAVVAAALRDNAGDIELVDFAAEFPSMLAREGLQTWQVIDPQTSHVIDSIEASSNPKIRASMFPSGDLEEMKKTRRFMPHLMNTGGFYVACFRRIKGGKAPHVGSKVAERQTGSFARQIEDTQWQALRDFYGVPDELKRQFIVPKDQEKRISFVSSVLADFIESQQADSALRVVSMGVRAFQLNTDNVWNSPTHFRLTQEGARALWQLMTRRVVTVPREVFMELVNKREVSPPEKFEGYPGWETIGEDCGACVMVCDGVPLACMAFGRSVQVFADKQYTEALSHVLTEAWTQQ